jgi:hypothetical protein
VIGPYFFEDEAGRMFCTFLELDFQRLGVETQTLWFQQDRTMAHTVRTAMRVLNKIFPAHMISRRGNLE